METTMAKAAKIIFVLALVAIFFQEKSIEALNIIRGLIINNILIIAIITIIILIWRTK